MTFVSLSQPAGWSCNSLTPGLGGTLTCSRDLPAGSGPQVFTLVGHIPSGTADGTLYNNMATVSTTATDPTAENNTATAGTTVSCATNPIVTTSADSGPGSLRKAIQDACVGSTITFDMSPGHVTSPITLTTAELAINKNLTITGPGANLLTVMRSAAGGTPNFRVFNIASGTVSISGLTISNGNGSFGGGILNQSTLTLIGSAISGNTASSTGGGIYNFGSGGTANVILNNTIVSDNKALNAANGPDIFNFSGTISGNNNVIQTSTGYTITGTNNSNVDPKLEKDGG